MASPSVASLILTFLVLLQIIKVDAANVSSIIVFGDSYVDAGNNNHLPTIVRSDFKPYGRDFEGGFPTGRFTNGRLSTDFISEAFGLKKNIPAYLDPHYTIKDFATGVCFASGASGYDDLTSHEFLIMNLWKQLEHYKKYQCQLKEHMGSKEADKVLGDALYIISTGASDFLLNYYLIPGRSLHHHHIEAYQKFLIGKARDFIKEIYKLGARKISLEGLPPMGCFPIERTANLIHKKECIDEHNKVAVDFNCKLKAIVGRLNMELSGLKLVLSDPYPVLYDIIQNPQSHCFENAAFACCGTGKFEVSYMCNKFSPHTCPDASKYVFWDSFHPTEKTHAILANYTLEKSLAVFR